MFDSIIQALKRIVVVVLNLLPESPFQIIEQDEEIQRILGYVNYIIPIDFFVACMVPWLSAIAIYYLYSLALRWGKAIE